VAVVVAWMFAIGTLAIVAYTAWSYWPGTAAGRSASIMSVTDDDGVLHALVGLRYVGVPGMVLLLTEIVVLLAALVMSVRSRSRWRSIGHGILVFWAGLWLGSGILIVSYDGASAWPVPVILALTFACTVARATRSSITTSELPY
jgi:hypothetical protein